MTAGTLRAEESETSLAATTAKVHDLLVVSCAECHDPDTNRRVKGDFDHVLDLNRMAEDEFYLVPGDPDFSELYLVMIDPDPDIVMPPPDSEAHQPTDDEIALVRDWISALEPGMDLEALRAKGEQKIIEPPVTEEEPVEKKRPAPKTLFARLHPLLVHFPIALLVVGGLTEWLGVFWKRARDWSAAVDVSIAVAAFFAPISALTGWLLADVQGYREATVGDHRTLGLITAALALGCLLSRLAQHRKPNVTRRWLFRLLVLAALVIVGMAGHTGGELVYGKGYPFL